MGSRDQTGTHPVLDVIGRRPLAVVALLALFAGGLVVQRFDRLSNELTETGAVEAARIISDALAEFRTLYTSEVVQRLAPEGVRVSHDYSDHAGGIPLPATLSMLLAENIGGTGQGESARLYSAHPFPWREETGGLRDSFEREAWAALSERPAEPFWRYEVRDGERHLRYATADLMRPSCVSCHNTHPDTPRAGWKTGDLRGVLEVSVPLQASLGLARTSIGRSVGLMLGMLGLGLGLLWWVLRGLRVVTNEAALQTARAEVELQRADLMQEARDAADEANRLKSQFLSNMSHELRTPLNAIIGYAELLHEEIDEMTPEEARADLSKVDAAGQHLLHLINEVLDLSRVEAGAIELDPEYIPLEDFLVEVVATVQPSVQKNGNRLVVVQPDAPGRVRTDRLRLHQILLNLLSNAAKFTKDGEIRLEVSEPEPGALEFRVIDAGIGIAPEVLERIFEPFQQADSSTTRLFGGTGLGLAISRRFAEMLGGGIDVVSEEGVGSTFTLRLPRGLPDAVAPGPGPSEGEPGAPHVLLIDDDPDVRQVLRRHLQTFGYRVSEADGGATGLAQVKAHHPDVVVLDVIMPGMDGWQVLDALKRDPATTELPVIMATFASGRAKGFSLGAVEFLPKPVTRSALLDAVQACVPRDALRRALVVEDHADSREMLTRSLEAEGWTVDEAANGLEGLARFDAQVPSLILLDLMMPVLDGFDFLDELDSRAGGSAVPVIVVTAKDLDSEERARLTGRVAEVVQKTGVDQRQLLRRIQSLVQARAGGSPSSES